MTRLQQAIDMPPMVFRTAQTIDNQALSETPTTALSKAPKNMKTIAQRHYDLTPAVPHKSSDERWVIRKVTMVFVV
jgi:hypothetical protein